MECSKYNSYIISGGVDGKLKLANSYYWYKKKMVKKKKKNFYL